MKFNKIPTEKTFPNHRLKAAACSACVAILTCVPSMAAIVYNLTDFAFVSFDGSDVHGTLQSSVHGVFSTVSEIEAFFNQSSYSVTLKTGSAQVFELHEGNSIWQFIGFDGGGGEGAILTSSPTGLILDFSTPIELTAVYFHLSADLNPGQGLQFSQVNNVTDSNFVGALNDLPSANAFLPYDSAFVFPAVPESSTLILCCAGLALSNFRRRPKE